MKIEIKFVDNENGDKETGEITIIRDTTLRLYQDEKLLLEGDFDLTINAILEFLDRVITTNI